MSRLTRFIPKLRMAIVPVAIILIGILVSWWLAAGIALGLTLGSSLAFLAIFS